MKHQKLKYDDKCCFFPWAKTFTLGGKSLYSSLPAIRECYIAYSFAYSFA